MKNLIIANHRMEQEGHEQPSV